MIRWKHFDKNNDFFALSSLMQFIPAFFDKNTCHCLLHGYFDCLTSQLSPIEIDYIYDHCQQEILDAIYGSEYNATDTLKTDIEKKASKSHDSKRQCVLTAMQKILKKNPSLIHNAGK